MWTISELKARGKATFKANYWQCVLASFVLALVVGTVGGYRINLYLDSNPGGIYMDSNGQILEEFRDAGSQFGKLAPFVSGTSVAFFGLTALVMAIGVLILKILVLNAMEVGCKRFFLMNLYERARVGEIMFAFSHNWMNCVKILFLRDLKVFLWSLLLVIPGIVKAYEYRMIPYLLAEDPYMSSEECFARSRQIMSGEKWATFVLDLSFLGWDILAGITGGLSGIFWSNPYMYATQAAQYDHFRTIERNQARYYGGMYTE